MGDCETTLSGDVESPMKHHSMTSSVLIIRETIAAGQFYWGGILLKSNGGVRRSAQFDL